MISGAFRRLLELRARPSLQVERARSRSRRSVWIIPTDSPCLLREAGVSAALAVRSAPTIDEWLEASLGSRKCLPTRDGAGSVRR